MTKATEPAFPIACPIDFQFAEPGLTKREYFAAMAMQAVGKTAITAELAAEWSTKLADALIAELNKKPPK